MKRYTLLFALTLSILAASLFGMSNTYANEKPIKEREKIEKMVNKIEGVKECRIFTHEDYVVVAVRTNSVYSKEVATKLIEKIKTNIQSQFKQFTKVKVTMSLKAFRAIEEINRMVDTGDVDIDDIWDKRPKPMPCPDCPRPNPNKKDIRQEKQKSSAVSQAITA